jgi:tRNA-dihydrouridine synthase A
MVDVTDLPVTVKHRIVLDKAEDYGFVRDFVGTVAQAGCRTFIVHARNAWLKGLSPKENREVPPLRYEVVYQLKRDFPDLTIVLNGGVNTAEQVHAALRQVDGVMIGREAYHNPYWLAQWDATFFGDASRSQPSREDIEVQMVAYMQAQWAQHQTPWYPIARHMLGLRHGLPGARHWRRVWSDHRLKQHAPEEVMQLAHSV